MNPSARGEAVEVFGSLGLTFSQARVYLALVENGFSTAKEISKISGVNRQEIYRIMPKLQDVCLVEKVISKPTRWKATPILDGLSILMKHRENEISELQAKAIKIIKEIKKNKKRAGLHKDEPEFVMMPGKDAHLKWLKNAYESIRKTNDSIVTWTDHRTINFLFDKELKDCSDRGVTTRVVIYVPETEKKIYETDPTFKSSLNEQRLFIFSPPLVLGGLLDKKELILATEKNNPIKTGEKVFWTNSPSIIALFQNYFEQLWKTAHSKKHKRRTVITTNH